VGHAHSEYCGATYSSQNCPKANSDCPKAKGGATTPSNRPCYKGGLRSGGGQAATAEVAFPLHEEEITALAHYLANL
jgi:hypothetical protein